MKKSIHLPLVSVIIPTKKNPYLLKPCLTSVYNQTYKNIEVIVIAQKIITPFRLLQKEFGFFLKENTTGKSESRNVGSNVAKGSFLLHIDDDMILDKKVIEECVELAKKNNLKTVAIPEKQEKGGSFFNAITVLEKEIVSFDKYIVAPRFIEKNLFIKLGGFNPLVDPIDEGELKAKLKEHKINYENTKNTIQIIKSESTFPLKKRIIRMYKRGQKQQLFDILHPHSKQLKPFYRLWPYVYFFPLFFRCPILYICLVCLKTLDLITLTIGGIYTSQKDKNYIAEIKNKSIFLTESISYQKEFYENSLGGNYVDKKEKEIVLDLLRDIDKSNKIKILDIGAGGGRWSKLMLEKFPNAKVTALDLSEGMVRNLKKNMESFGNRFSAQIGDMQNLPFTKNSFDAVMSIRAIKYAPNQDKVFSEIHRILKNQGTAVIELPYANTIYSFIRKVNIFGKLSEYVNRIQLRKKEDIEKNLRENKLFVEHSEIYFAVPATLYKKINNRFILKVLNFIDAVLSKDIFGRSIFIQLKTNNYSLANNPLVSVIIPTRNSEKFLDQCLSSIKNQTYKNIEIIVVDNNSTDETKEIAKKYTDKVFNKGPERSAQVNFGATKSKGGYIYKVDSDFILDKMVVKECIKKISEGFDAIVVHNTPDETVSWIAKIRKFEVDMYKFNLTHSSARFVNKIVYKNIGGFDKRITAGEDYDFQNKLNRNGYRTGFIEAEAVHKGEPISLWKHMKKYYNYGKDFVNFRKNNISESNQQLNFFRFIYFKNWKKFIEHPLLGIEFIAYHIFKYGFGVVGYSIKKIKKT